VNIVSNEAFGWIVTALTGGLAGTWVVHDLLFLARLRGKDRRDPLVRDQAFGYVMGIVIGVIGVWGCMRFNGVI
jgi:hypothetical protein